MELKLWLYCPYLAACHFVEVTYVNWQWVGGQCLGVVCKNCSSDASLVCVLWFSIGRIFDEACNALYRTRAWDC